MTESTTLAVIPLIVGMLVMALRFYAREGAISIFSPSFLFAALAVLLLFSYMTLTVVAMLPPYAWVGFGGVGAAMAIFGIWSFFR